MTVETALLSDLRSVLGGDAVFAADRSVLADAAEAQVARGSARALLRPADAAAVAAAVTWCYAHDVAMTPRGGGTGLAGGAVPFGEEVIIDMGRLDRIRALDPALWRAHAEAGVVTGTLSRLARENGLLFPPDPGAAEQSQLGGNIATNAGGPHAFKYGVTGNWVTGLEAVIAPGELISIGGPLRKDVAGYDLRSLLIGSEGTLGLITAAWLRLTPAPESSYPVAAVFADAAAGCEAIEAVVGIGLDLSVLEFLDAPAFELAAASSPWAAAADRGFVVLAEVDGREESARLDRAELLEQWRGWADHIHAPESRADVQRIWRWRDGVSLAVRSWRGAKVSEDVVVPLDRLREAIDGVVEIGREHAIPACSWGHAGDGNLHATFMVDPDDPDDLARAAAAAVDLFAMTISLGGSISGEHGLGSAKAGQLRQQWPAGAVRLHETIKDAFDPKGLFNPGKKQA